MKRFLLSLFFLAQANAQCRREQHVLINDRCYIFVPKEHTFPSAYNYCSQDNSKLAVVDSIFINNYLASLATNEFRSSDGKFWIGLNRTGDTFQWSDGSPVKFTNWVRGFPNGQSSVLEKISDGKWMSEDPFQMNPYVCFYGKTATRPTTNVPGTTTKASGITIEVSGTTARIRTTPQAVPAARTTRSARSGCPAAFTKGPDNNCYGIIFFSWQTEQEQEDPLNREEELCADYNAKVASIHSATMNEFIRQVVFQFSEGRTYVTIGLQNTSKGWGWSDGTPYDYTNFKSGFPRGSDLLAQIQEDGAWISYTHTVPTEGVLCRIDY